MWTDDERRMAYHRINFPGAFGPGELKSCRFDEIFFGIILLYIHVQYVCNESAKYQNASANTLRRVDLTEYALHSRDKAAFKQKRGK